MKSINLVFDIENQIDRFPYILMTKINEFYLINWNIVRVLNIVRYVLKD